MAERLAVATASRSCIPLPQRPMMTAMGAHTDSVEPRAVRALICAELGDEDRLRIGPWAVSSCGEHGVRIAVEAMSVNFPDVLVIRGLYQHKPDLPFVPGCEAAGIVTEIGPGIDDLSVGDRVVALVGRGAFATEIVATRPQHQIHRIPDAMPFDHAAAFNLTYGTSMHALRQRGTVQPDETVLVLGAAGGCGSAAVQIAKAMGAQVIAVAGGPEKCALAARAGADHTVDHLTETALSSRVREITGGRGVDVVVDNVGGADIREYLRCLAWNGRYLVVGFAAGTVPTVALNQTILKSISLVGVAYGMSAGADAPMNDANLTQLFEWYEAGLCTPIIGHHFPFDRAAEAIKVMHDRGALGKIVITR